MKREDLGKERDEEVDMEMEGEEEETGVEREREERDRAEAAIAPLCVDRVENRESLPSISLHVSVALAFIHWL